MEKMGLVDLIVAIGTEACPVGNIVQIRKGWVGHFARMEHG